MPSNNSPSKEGVLNALALAVEAEISAIEANSEYLSAAENSGYLAELYGAAKLVGKLQDA